MDDALPQLLALLRRKAGGRMKAEMSLAHTQDALGLRGELREPTLVAIALCSLGSFPDEVSRFLDWREFESFCAKLLVAWGFDVQENLHLKKPRAQIDIVAKSPSVIITIDCKDWGGSHSPSSLRKFAAAQLRRSGLLRKQMGNDWRPIFSAMLTLSEQRERVVEGVAVIPLHTLRDFLGSLGAPSVRLAAV